MEETKRRSGIDSSPIVLDDEELNEWLSTQGNLKFEAPRYDSLTRTDAAKIITEAVPVQFGGAAVAAPLGIGTHVETAVRTERANWWSASKLSKYFNLRQHDPVGMILNDLAGYWAFQDQLMFLNMWIGVFADNDIAPGGADTHTQGDLTLDRSAGGVFSAGVTNFTAENFIDACQKMGDNKNSLGYIVTHSVVESTMEKGDLLDVVKDSQGGAPNSYRGRPIIVNDEMTKGAGNVYHTYIFGAGSTRRGQGTPDVPLEMARYADGGNGAGMNVVWNRIRRCYHPSGYRFMGTPAAVGGVSDAELATAANWSRSTPERKNVKAVRLITTES
jgi:hypothetical protein